MKRSFLTSLPASNLQQRLQYGQAVTPNELAEEVVQLRNALSQIVGELGMFNTDLSYNLNNISARDAWQDSESDNVASGYPLELNLYIPEGSQTRLIHQVYLTIWLQAFRSYGTGAASQNLGTVSISTSTSGPSSVSFATTGASSTTKTTTGASSTTKTTTGPSSTSTTSETAHYHADEYYTSGPQNWGTPASHYHNIGIHNTYTSGAHSHGMSHDHTVDISHTHDVNIDHTHTVSISHSHDMSHSHAIGSHSHDLVHGIYVGSTASGCTILINGVDVTNDVVGAATFGTNQTRLDITQYIDKGDNTIQITSATLGRIRASVFCNVYLNG